MLASTVAREFRTQAIQVGQRLRRQHERRAKLAQFRQHTAEIDAAQRLELVDEDQQRMALVRRAGGLFFERHAQRPQDRRPHQAGGLRANEAPRGIDDEDLAFPHHRPQIEGRLRLADDAPGRDHWLNCAILVRTGLMTSSRKRG